MSFAEEINRLVREVERRVRAEAIERIGNGGTGKGKWKGYDKFGRPIFTGANGGQTYAGSVSFNTGIPVNTTVHLDKLNVISQQSNFRQQEQIEAKEAELFFDNYFQIVRPDGFCAIIRLRRRKKIFKHYFDSKGRKIGSETLPRYKADMVVLSYGCVWIPEYKDTGEVVLKFNANNWYKFNGNFIISELLDNEEGLAAAQGSFIDWTRKVNDFSNKSAFPVQWVTRPWDTSVVLGNGLDGGGRSSIIRNGVSLHNRPVFGEYDSNEDVNDYGAGEKVDILAKYDVQPYFDINWATLNYDYIISDLRNNNRYQSAIDRSRQYYFGTSKKFFTLSNLNPVQRFNYYDSYLEEVDFPTYLKLEGATPKVDDTCVYSSFLNYPNTWDYFGTQYSDEFWTYRIGSINGPILFSVIGNNQDLYDPPSLGAGALDYSFDYPGCGCNVYPDCTALEPVPCPDSQVEWMVPMGLVYPQFPGGGIHILQGDYFPTPRQIGGTGIGATKPKSYCTESVLIPLIYEDFRGWKPVFIGDLEFDFWASPEATNSYFQQFAEAQNVPGVYKSHSARGYAELYNVQSEEPVYHEFGNFADLVNGTNKSYGLNPSGFGAAMIAPQPKISRRQLTRIRKRDDLRIRDNDNPATTVSVNGEANYIIHDKSGLPQLKPNDFSYYPVTKDTTERRLNAFHHWTAIAEGEDRVIRSANWFNISEFFEDSVFEAQITLPDYDRVVHHPWKSVSILGNKLWLGHPKCYKHLDEDDYTKVSISKYPCIWTDWRNPKPITWTEYTDLHIYSVREIMKINTSTKKDSEFKSESYVEWVILPASRRYFDQPPLLGQIRYGSLSDFLDDPFEGGILRGTFDGDLAVYAVDIYETLGYITNFVYSYDANGVFWRPGVASPTIKILNDDTILCLNESSDDLSLGIFLNASDSTGSFVGDDELAQRMELRMLKPEVNMREAAGILPVEFLTRNGEVAELPESLMALPSLAYPYMAQFFQNRNLNSTASKGKIELGTWF